MWLFNCLKKIFLTPLTFMYYIYDHLCVHFLRLDKRFNGWGIHLYVGKFGSGKTSAMVIDAYNKCKKYKELSVVTNINLQNFPSWTKIYPLNSPSDIVNAPNNSLILIDEIGTIFNSRDFSSGQRVPKTVYQHLCQCRKRNIMIMATVQRYNLLDKQIRDISSDVTTCHMLFSYPYSRLFTLKTYDTEDWEMYCTNPTFCPRAFRIRSFYQTNFSRTLYDTSQLITSLLDKDYLSDTEILTNQGATSQDMSVLDRKARNKINRTKRGV